MNITVIDESGRNRTFSIEDFVEFKNAAIAHPNSQELMAERRFDGSIIRRVATIRSDTTHLILGTLDRLTKKELPLLPHLQYVGLATTGWWDDPERFDLKAMKRRNITMSIAKGYANDEIARFILQRLNPRTDHSVAVIGGTGDIGNSVIRLLKENHVAVTSVGKEINEYERIRALSEADAITMHVSKRVGVVLGSSEFDALKPDVTIFNHSGVENIDIHRLSDFLAQNPKAVYIHDAMPDEKAYRELRSAAPYQVDLPLKPRASTTPESMQQRKEITLSNLRDFLRGKVTNAVASPQNLKNW